VAQNPAHLRTAGGPGEPDDPDLAAVLAAWPALTQGERRAVRQRVEVVLAQRR